MHIHIYTQCVGDVAKLAAIRIHSSEYCHHLSHPHILAEQRRMHRKKKVREFPVPRRDVNTKLSLGGNNDVITEVFLPRGSLVSDIPAGDWKLVNLFLRCGQGVTKRCRLCWLTSYMSPNAGGMGGGGCGVSAKEYSCVQWSPNTLWRSNSIFDL